MKRPFFIVAFLFCVGILLGDFLQPSLSGLFVVSLATAFAALFFTRARPYLLCLLLILTGWTNQVRTTAILSPVDLRTFLSTNSELATIRGTIKSTPSERIIESNNKETWRSMACVELEGILRDNQWQEAQGEVIVSINGLLGKDYGTGRHVEIDGVIAPPGGPKAPGLFDYGTYLRRNGIYYQFTSATNDWRILPQTPPFTRALTERFHDWADRTLSLGLPEEDLPLRLMKTLLLDWKAPMTASVEEPFVRAGTFHVFAVDGLRMGLIAGILLLFFRVIQIPRIINGSLVIAALWFYTSLTGFPASAIRASIMMTVILLGWTLKRPGDLLNSLFASAFLILVWNPQQLFLPGFQLSFLVVLCIALILAPAPRSAVLKAIHDPKIQKPTNWWNRIKFRCELWIIGDPLLPDSAKPRWRHWLLQGFKSLWKTTEMSWAAWIGSIPLAACYFHIFNPVSVLSNILVVPLTILALASCLASLTAGLLCWNTGAALFNHTSWLLLYTMNDISRWFAKLPLCWNVEAPSTLALVTLYIVILSIGSGWIFHSSHRKWLIAVNSILILLCSIQYATHRNNTQLFILPADGGHVLFVKSHNPAESILINCGNTRPAEGLTKPFLQAQGINDICHLGINHNSARNMGGFAILNTHFNIHELLISSNRTRSPIYKKLSPELKKVPQIQYAKPEQIFATLTILHPPPTPQLSKVDENSIVLQTRIHGQSILCLSDLDAPSQTTLVQEHPDLRTDILITGLSTAREPLSEILLTTLKPRLILVADSTFPATRRATSEFRSALLKNGIPVFFCRDTGAVTFTFRDSQWQLRDASDRLIIDDRLDWKPPVSDKSVPPQDAENDPSADSE